MEKRVLIIAFAFPPISGSGALRTVKFTKYLPEFNWIPVVLTVKDKYSKKKDPELLREIPENITIIRTKMSNPLEWILSTNNILKSLTRKKKNELTDEIRNNKKQFVSHSERRHPLKQFLIDWFNFPDSAIGWLPWAYFHGRKAIRDSSPQVIYTTSPPASTHIIGYFLKRYSKVSWIADFRDPWDVEYFSRDKSVRRKRLEYKLKQTVLRHADKIIANTDALREELYLTNPELDKSKIIVIPNGYDHEDFLFSSEDTKPEKGNYVISHVGELYPNGRRPDNFLFAISSLIKERKIEKRSIKINFIGDEDVTPNKEFENQMKSLGLSEIVTAKKHVSHKESIQYLLNSNLLLLLQTGKRFQLQVPAKVYEYMATKKPILALTPEGETARIVSQYPKGKVVDPEDIEKLKSVIQELILNDNVKTPDLLEEFVSSFDRRKQTERLSQILDKLVSDNAE